MSQDAQNTNQSHTKVTLSQVEACLAQTQCTECGYLGCRPYAEAILNGDAINKCRPGGQRVIQKLAKLLNMPQIDPNLPPRCPEIAVVKEDLCIGCTKCQQVCPTDAILGAPKLKHQVLQGDCTGCRLCLPVCPTDCIVMEETTEPSDFDHRCREITALTQAKKQRKDKNLLRDLQNLEQTVTTTVPPLQLDEKTAQKLAQAKTSATKKWTEKKSPAQPKLFQNR